METVQLTVSDFVAVTNQTLEYAYPLVEVEGEVASFKVNQGKYVFFDLKDSEGTISCFMSVWQLRVPIEDGMKVVIIGAPKLTAWGRFSVTVRSIRPSGEGALKKSFEILRAKLDKEGLFADSRKRSLPYMPEHIAVISSTQAAGYADFLKILGDRWAGVSIDVAHVQVQGARAAEQIVQAISYFNEQEQPPEALAIVRGGGSADDLSVFNDEPLVRAIAASRVPIITGIGHEIDESLADLAADVRAATPSNAAQLLVPDKQSIVVQLQAQLTHALRRLEGAIDDEQRTTKERLGQALRRMSEKTDRYATELTQLRRVLLQFDPHSVLARGYALLRGEVGVGKQVTIETVDKLITARVESYEQK
jgi:exodeoxyribonuclease VII large subunit